MTFRTGLHNHLHFEALRQARSARAGSAGRTARLDQERYLHCLDIRTSASLASIHRY